METVAVSEVTADENAALRYWRVWTLYPDDLREELRDAEVNDPAYEVSDELRELLEQQADAIELLFRAVEMPECDFGIDYDLGPEALLPHLAPMRASYRLLAVHGRERLEAGDVDGAVRANAAMYGLVDHLRGDRVLISSLVGIAISAAALEYTDMLVGSAELSPAHRDTLCAAIGRFPERDPFAIADGIMGEKEMFIGWLQRRAGTADASFAKDLTEWGVDLPQNLERVLRLENAETRGVAVRAMADPFERAYEEFAKAWVSTDRTKLLADVEEKLGDGDFGPLAKVFAPAVSRMAENEDKVVERMAEVTGRLGCK